MKRFIALGRVVHLLGFIVDNQTEQIFDANHVLTAVCTVRCPDDENRFAGLPTKEADEKEKNLIETILHGRIEKGPLITADYEQNGEKISVPIMVARSKALPIFTQKEIEEFENQLVSAIQARPQSFFKFNPDLSGSVVKKNNKLGRKVMTE